MKNSILNYQNRTSFSVLISNLSLLSEYLVKSQKVSCTCLFSTNENGVLASNKSTCTLNKNNNLKKLFNKEERVFKIDDDIIFIDKTDSNEIFFCNKIHKYIITTKKYYDKEIKVVIGFEENHLNNLNISKEFIKTAFDITFKSAYYEDMIINAKLNMKDLVLIIDKNGYVRFIDSRLQNLLNISVEDIHSINIIDLYEKYDDTWLKQLNDILAIKPFYICDETFKGNSNKVSLRKKIFKGNLGDDDVIFLTSEDINNFRIINRNSTQNKKEEIINKNYDITKSKIKLKVKNDLKLQKIDDIVYCKLISSYIELYLTNGEKITMLNLGSEISSKLISHGFFQIHKSYIINLSYVKNYSIERGKDVNLSNGISLPIAIRRHSSFISVMNENFL